MIFKRPYFNIEVYSTSHEDEIFFRLKITDHKPLNLIKDQIFELSNIMYHGFRAEFDNENNAKTAMKLFLDESRLQFIRHSEFPIIDERNFSINEILKEGQIETTLLNGDMFSGKDDARLTEKTLIYIEAFQMIRPHVRWIKFWNE